TSTQKLPIPPARLGAVLRCTVLSASPMGLFRLARPRTMAIATAMPDAADIQLWMASATMLEKYETTVSGTYDCQFVFVVNEAAVLNARSGVISLPLNPCGLRGKMPCRRKST